MRRRMPHVDAWLFFFSSRRRHTRCGRDWSSDVCSSDLPSWITRIGPGWSSVSSGACPGRMPRSPIMPAAITCSTSPEKTDASALTMLHLKLFAIAKSPWWTALLHLVGFLDGLVDGADHVEGLLGQLVILAVEDALEAADGVLEGHVLAGRPGEHLGHEERLRQEALDLARPRHGQFVLVGELVHAQDRDDVLELLVALQHVLNTAGGVVVLLADDQRVELTRGGVQRIDGRIDTQLGDGARQYHGGVQVREGGRRRRVGQVIRGHVDSLHGGDRAGLGGGDALLEHTHLLGQGRLVTHRGGHPAQQGGDLGTGQGVAVDVVDEQQHVAAFIAELLGDGQTGQGHTQAVAGRLVHLAVDQRYLVDDVGLGHFVVEVVTLTGTLAHARKHRVAAVLGGDVADQLHHVDGLAHTGAAEQADLAALGERADQVDDLDAGLEQLVGGRLVGVARCLAVDRHALFFADLARLVDGLAKHVHDAAQRRLAHRHGDGRAGVGDVHATLEALGGAHGDGAHHAVAQLLLGLEHGLDIRDLQRVVDLGNIVPRKLYVNHRADDLYDTSAHLGSSQIPENETCMPGGPWPPWRLYGGGTTDDLGDFLGNGRLTGLVVHQLQVVDQIAGVVGGTLHGDHPRGLLAGPVLDHRLVHLRFDESHQQAVQQRLGIRLIQVVPATGTLVFFVVRLRAHIGRQGQQLTDHRLLGHGVDELVVHHAQAVQLALVVGIQHHLHAADQVLDLGRLAQATLRGDEVAPVAAEEGSGLAAQGTEVELGPLVTPRPGVLDHGLEQVDVQADTQAAVGGDHDVTDALDLALDHPQLTILRIGIGDMRDHVADLTRIGLAGLHQVLGLAHLRRRDHFHGAGDLLRVLDAPDLGAYLFCSCHSDLLRSWHSVSSRARPAGGAGQRHYQL